MKKSFSILVLILVNLTFISKAYSNPITYKEDNLEFSVNNPFQGKTIWSKIANKDDFDYEFGNFIDGWRAYNGQSEIFVFYQPHVYTLDSNKIKSVMTPLKDDYGCNTVAFKNPQSSFSKQVTLLELKCNKYLNNTNSTVVNIKPPVIVKWAFFPKGEYLLIFALYTNQKYQKESEEKFFELVNSIKLLKDLTDISEKEYIENWEKEQLSKNYSKKAEQKTQQTPIQQVTPSPNLDFLNEINALKKSIDKLNTEIEKINENSLKDKNELKELINNINEKLKDKDNTDPKMDK